jgi:hypothetical protein
VALVPGAWHVVATKSARNAHVTEPELVIDASRQVVGAALKALPAADPDPQ